MSMWEIVLKTTATDCIEIACLQKAILISLAFLNNSVISIRALDFHLYDHNNFDWF